MIRLSIIVSSKDSEGTLHKVLTAIRSSTLPSESYELIVVDDGSSDRSVTIAARYADSVVRLTGGGDGPAYARNRGCEIARGEILAFIDQDVVIDADCLSRMLDMLDQQSQLTAVSARYQEIGTTGFLSSYWNLLAAFGEKRHGGQCALFASGCGMIRRTAFMSVGMYDEWRFNKGCLESVELGKRLLAAGHRATLESRSSVTRLQRLSLSVLFAHVWRRSTLLARSLGYAETSNLIPGEVVFTLTRGLIPSLAIFAILTLGGAVYSERTLGLPVALAFGIMLVSSAPIHLFYVRQRGPLFALLSAPLHVVIQLLAAAALCRGWFLRDIFGDVSPDATTQAYSEIGLETWPPVRRRLS
ncbi:MAG: hypothetical protein V7640_3202 [Betaproteobacteria bacterium]